MSVLKKNIGIFCLSFLSAAFLFAADKYNNNIKGYASNILAGTNNTTSGLSSAILNGDRNTVSGQFSTAGGAGSVSNATGTFTWSDSANVIGVWTNNNILNHTWFKTRGGFSVTISTNMADGGLFMRDNYVSIGTTTTPSTFTVNGTMTVFSTVTAAAYAGDGSALVNLNASALSSGTVNDLRLSSNVSLLNSTQTATADKAFSNRVLIGTSTISESTATLTLYGSIRIVDGNEGLGRVLTGIDGAGFGTWRVPSVTGQNVYYLTPYLADISGFYYMDIDISSTVAVTTSTWAGIASDVVLSSFTTRAGYPGALRTPGGQVTLNLWLAKTGGTKDLSGYAKIYKWDGTTRTLLATSELFPLVTSATPEKYTTSATIPNSVDWTANDRLQVVFYSHVSGTGSAPTLQAFKGGTYYEEVQVPAAVINASNYVVKDSSGNVDLDGHNLSAAYIVATSSMATPLMYSTNVVVNSTVTSKLAYANNVNRTEGLISTPTITLDGTATVSITSTTVLIRDSSAFTGNIAYATVPAVSNFALTNNSINFIYVDYNGGTPAYKAATTDALSNSSNYLRVARLYIKNGAIEYLFYNGATALGNPSKNYERVMRVRGVNGMEIESGFTLSETTGRVINIAAGVSWFGLDRFPLGAQTSLTSACHYWTHNSAGNWIETSTKAYINDVYDTITGTQALTTNRYAVNYIYGNGKTGEIDIYLGMGDYTASQAAAAAITLPSVAPQTNWFYLPIGSIVVMKGASSATNIYQITKTAFTANNSTIDASQVVSGTLDAARLPNIPAALVDLSTVTTAIAAETSRAQGVESALSISTAANAAAISAETSRAQAVEASIAVATTTLHTEQVPTARIDLSTVTTAINAMVPLSGGNMTGQLTTASTMTVQGSAFSVGGSTFTVANGKVGVGMAPDTGILTALGIIKSSGSANSLMFGDRGNSAHSWEWYSSGDTAGLYKNHNTAGTVLYAAPSGNIGVGTSSPAKKLHVHSTSADNHLYVSGVGPELFLSDSETVAGATKYGIAALATTAGQYGSLAAGDFLLLANHPTYISANYYQTSANALILQPTSGPGAGGKVGIGNVSPAEALDVTGNIKMSGDIIGKTDGSNAAAGGVGEIVSSRVIGVTPSPNTSGTHANITSISLGAGDWIISAVCGAYGYTSMTAHAIFISLYSGEAITDLSEPENFVINNVASGITRDNATIPAYHLSLSSTTTVYLKARVDYGGTAGTAYGFIIARRIR